MENNPGREASGALGGAVSEESGTSGGLRAGGGRRLRPGGGAGEAGQGRSCELGHEVHFPQGCPRERRGFFRHRKCLLALHNPLAVNTALTGGVPRRLAPFSQASHPADPRLLGFHVFSNKGLGPRQTNRPSPRPRQSGARTGGREGRPQAPRKSPPPGRRRSPPPDFRLAGRWG